MLQQFFAGVAYPFEGLRFIQEHRLWRTYLWIMVGIVLVYIVVFAVVSAGALLLVKPVLSSLGTFLSSTFSVQSAFAAHLVTVITYIVWAVVVLAVMGMSGIAVVLGYQALAMPLLDVLSEKIEILVLATPMRPLTPQRIARDVIIGMSDLIWGALSSIAVYGALFFVGLIPGVGTIPAALCSYIFAALLMSHALVGLPLTRRFVSYRGRWQAVRDNLSVMLGFGTTTLLLGFFVLPLASVGGTLLFCDLIASKRL